MVVGFEFDGECIVVSLFGVEFVAIQKYLVYVSMELSNVLVPVPIYLLLDSLQVHGLMDDLQIVGHSLVDRIHWLSEWPWSFMRFDLSNEAQTKLFVLKAIELIALDLGAQ